MIASQQVQLAVASAASTIANQSVYQLYDTFMDKLAYKVAQYLNTQDEKQQKLLGETNGNELFSSGISNQEPQEQDGGVG